MKIKGANWKRLLSVLLACVMLLANVGLAEEMPAAEEMPVVEVEAQPAEQEPAVEEPAAPAPEPEPVKEEATAAPEKEPEETKAPEVSEGPTAEPEVTEEPQPSEETEDEPEATEEPAVTEEAVPTEEPAAAEDVEELEELSVQFWTDMRYAVAGTEAMRFQLRVAGGAAPYQAEIVVLCNGSEAERNMLAVSEAEEIAVMPQNAGSYTVQVTVSDANGNTAFAQAELPVSGTETESDWTAAFRGVRLSGDFAADLIAIAKTQLGYQESEKNFVIDGNGQKKGYTRYGDWYGSAYADWNALFVSFCASYAEVSGFPTAASAAALKQALGNAYKTGSYAPKAGDLVFLNNPERVAVIASVDGKTIRAIEGDVKGSVANTQYTVGSSEIAGYMAMDVLKQRAGLAVAEDEEPADEENTTVAVNSALTVTAQPTDAKVAENATAYFTVKASGTGLTYQWQFSTEGKTWSNTKMSGYNTATLQVQALSYRNNYYYRCVITDAQGNSVTTNGAKLTIGETSAIGIIEQPKDAMVAENATASFTVKASGTGLSYQWQFFSTDGKTWSNTKMSGYNTATLQVQALSYRNNYYYRCVITDAQGNSVTTNGAKLIIGASAEIRITTQPANATVKENEEALFTVKAEGTGLSYQWQFSTDGKSWSNTKMSGYNTATLQVQALSHRNNYYYRCVIKDAQGNSATSEAGQLLIQSDIVIDDVLYKEIDGGIEVAKYNGSSASLTIPETVNGKTVIRIGASAFEGNTTLTSINLPDTVQVIGERAFANCTNLSEMN